ncbi:unnamed protein product [Symbiodinium sp. CCMP2592]|nr:unnamed protein product [Symbiodinium sp. CCMP2592]
MAVQDAWQASMADIMDDLSSMKAESVFRSRSDFYFRAERLQGRAEQDQACASAAQTLEEATSSVAATAPCYQDHTGELLASLHGVQLEALARRPGPGRSKWSSARLEAVAA